MTGARGVIVAALAVSLTACARLPKVFRVVDPLNAEEHARLGAAYEARGQKKDAEAQYRLAVALDRRLTGAWMALGNLAFEAGDFKAAQRRYKRVLAIVPRHPGASNNLAMVYLAQNRRLDEAEALARDALAQGSDLEPYILDTLAQLEKRAAGARAERP